MHCFPGVKDEPGTSPVDKTEPRFPFSSLYHCPSLHLSVCLYVCLSVCLAHSLAIVSRLKDSLVVSLFIFLSVCLGLSFFFRFHFSICLAYSGLSFSALLCSKVLGTIVNQMIPIKNVRWATSVDVSGKHYLDFIVSSHLVCNRVFLDNKNDIKYVKYPYRNKSFKWSK